MWKSRKISYSARKKASTQLVEKKMAERDGFSTGFFFHRNSFPFKRKMWKKKVYELYKNGAGRPL